MKFIYPEGATPLDDISGLKPSWVKTQEDLNNVEAENISNAASTHLLKSVSAPEHWFKGPFLQKLHYDMFRDVWEWAGKFRTTQTCPGIKPFQIHGALTNLCDDVRYWCGVECNLPIIEQAARIHHQLVFIHPFLNGNGRFSRLVSDRFLKGCKYPFPNWPIDLDKDGRSRAHYIAALKKADLGDYEPLVIYMMEQTVQGNVPNPAKKK
ncbi:MAG TPA: mobile mystery protein B [Rhabdochlamydiaceae bacterium]